MDISITSPNKGIREESLRQTYQAVDLARDLGSRLIVIHPGSRFSILEDPISHWAHQVSSIGKILDYAKQQGVIAAVENMDSDKEIVSVKDWDDLDRLFNDVGSKENRSPWTLPILETQRPLWISSKSRGHIAHFHLSDGTKEKMHLRIGAESSI